ncbi:MAG: CatB-related O-acetyltransferase [Maribacter sp.]
MRAQIKKIILSSKTLTQIVVFFHKKKLSRKFTIKYAENVLIGVSTICEGRNAFGLNSSITGSKIGYASYISANTIIAKTEIGRYTSIGPNVNCIFGKHPSNTFVSTHPAFFSTKPVTGLSYTKINQFKEFEDTKDPDGKYSIRIGNDVWIGANVSIMDGVEIGDGAIVAANALVNKDVAPYSIVGGVPAKLIKNRFSEDHVSFLLKFKWWNKPEKWVIENASLFIDIDNFFEKFNNV